MDSNQFDRLPPEIARHRVLDAAEACEFVKISLPHWRRMYRNGDAPTPIHLGVRKLGWRVGDLIAWLDQRQGIAAA